MFTLNSTTLEEKAERTFILLTESIINGELLSRILSTYYNEFAPHPTETFGIKRKESFSPEDSKRIILELISFATFLIMMKEAPKHIQKRTFLFIKSPDAERVSYYNSVLFNLLDAYLDEQEYNGIHEIVLAQIYPEVKFEEGEVIDLTSRVTKYINSGDSTSATDLFVALLISTIDCLHSSDVEPLALHFASAIHDWTKVTAKNVFC